MVVSLGACSVRSANNRARGPATKLCAGGRQGAAGAFVQSIVHMPGIEQIFADRADVCIEAIEAAGDCNLGWGVNGLGRAVNDPP
jgi:hypothetical protein